jgi:hypothetical protein
MMILLQKGEKYGQKKRDKRIPGATDQRLRLHHSGAGESGTPCANSANAESECLLAVHAALSVTLDCALLHHKRQ